ncbi:hypothetical protein N7517_010038 [Penicillium concentricum]|uniref:RNase III domain-containing protein n=1 Tax=Penicillium concentricum TaxID=293559 RepID=A0A9W9RID0_9EURO|nr:uncharacterized protein N7517_010038 [Penicillium concentricum]KAJ5360847.1 hypothetical protein N7517_010038 [Penicillium concentricum]
MVIFMDLPSDQEIEVFENVVLQKVYHFTQRALIREALQGSAPFNAGGNKTLAMAGDALLDQSLIDQGRSRKKSPEEITNVLNTVASNKNLRDRAIAIGLDPFLIKNPGQWGVIAGKNVMADAMQAIIGAVYYDSNKNREDCERVMAVLGISWPE